MSESRVQNSPERQTQMTSSLHALVIAIGEGVEKLCDHSLRYAEAEKIKDALVKFRASLDAPAPATDGAQLSGISGELTLRVGAYYLDREGRKHGPMRHYRADGTWKDFCWTTTGAPNTWTHKGSYFISEDESVYDLIRECPPDASAVGAGVSNVAIEAAISGYIAAYGLSHLGLHGRNSMKVALTAAAPLIAEDLRKEVERLKQQKENLSANWAQQHEAIKAEAISSAQEVERLESELSALRRAPSEEDVERSAKRMFQVLYRRSDWDRSQAFHEGFRECARAILCEGQTKP